MPEEALSLKTTDGKSRAVLAAGTGALGSFPCPGHAGSFPLRRGWCGEGAVPSRLAPSTSIVKGNSPTAVQRPHCQDKCTYFEK